MNTTSLAGGDGGQAVVMVHDGGGCQVSVRCASVPDFWEVYVIQTNFTPTYGTVCSTTLVTSICMNNFV